MPRIPGFPEEPQYNSVKVYLSELAKDIAEMVVDPVKMERFREQLKIYANLWKQWTTFEEADRQGCWEPSMGRPECIFNIFSRSYKPLKDSEKEAKRLAGSYALCALIHDSQLTHLDKINTDIIPIEAIEETLSSPRNMLEARLVGNWNSGPDVREIYLIEEFFNRANVDLRELCNSEKNKLTQASIEEQIQNANELSDTEFLELTAKKFEQRAKKVLSTDETWHDLDRSLRGWFDTVIGRLKKSGFPDNDIGLLKYLYKNLLHYARGINIKSFRGFPDPTIVSYARKQASELAEKFKGFSQRVKDNLASEKSEEKEKQKVKHEDKIHSSGNDGGNSMEWDVFICHASEDKENFVDPLANVLKEDGIKVWYDRFELKLGDSLRGKIDEGLANSRYGVIVLSRYFFKKEWPKTELDALVSRQNEKGKKVILPIWHGIGIEEVRKFSKILASKLAAQSSESLESIVVQIKNVLNENSTPEKPSKDKNHTLSRKDYEEFSSIHHDFSLLVDPPSEITDSDFEFNKTNLYYKIEMFYDRFVQICVTLGISLHLTGEPELINPAMVNYARAVCGQTDLTKSDSQPPRKFHVNLEMIKKTIFSLTKSGQPKASLHESYPPNLAKAAIDKMFQAKLVWRRDKIKQIFDILLIKLQELFELKDKKKMKAKVHKPRHKKVLAIVGGFVIFLAAFTTLLLNFDKIIEIFRGETGKQSYSSKPFNGSKLDISLRTICQDIDSRPLTQKKETAEKYVGIKINEERLKLLDISKSPEGDIYLLEMVFPDQSDTSYSTGRRIICDIPKEQHPELNLAKQGVELYISGQIKEAGAKYIELSDVSLKFD